MQQHPLSLHMHFWGSISCSPRWLGTCCSHEWPWIPYSLLSFFQSAGLQVWRLQLVWKTLRTKSRGYSGQVTLSTEPHPQLFKFNFISQIIRRCCSNPEYYWYLLSLPTPYKAKKSISRVAYGMSCLWKQSSLCLYTVCWWFRFTSQNQSLT